MGAGALTKESTISLFDQRYQRERADLRKSLIQSFLHNPNHQDVIEKISIMRKLLIEHDHICSTAAEEVHRAEVFDALPTNLQAAYHELDRLVALYETSTILKSVDCRIGPVACPLGHYAGYVEDFQTMINTNNTTAIDSHPSSGNSNSSSVGERVNTMKCNICHKTVQDGYHCGYCLYNLCIPCSTIYCCNGHTMKLWTHPESQHHCIVCKKQPITSGYRCLICEDYDICDYCTWIDGRKAVQQVILDRIGGHLAYMEAHTSESETASRIITSHSMKITGRSYDTTKHLFDFSLEVKELRAVVKAEVRQTRITRAIEALRSELTQGKEFSRTAYLESLVIENFTMEELKRLRQLKEWYDDLRSVSKRCLQPIACPLGHYCIPYEQSPPPYETPTGPPPSLSIEIVRESISLGGSKRIDTSNNNNTIGGGSSRCMICDRLATSKGCYYCSYCDYSLCSICSIIYCKKGHHMILWTEPCATEIVCYLCQKKEVTSGYYCKECDLHLCDLCTTKIGRDRIRNDWEAEMGNLVGFMKRNRRSSDIANFYQWRHANQVVSVGLLVDYVQELRTAKDQAQKQIEQKPIIDQIKAIRMEVCKHPEFCATAAREATRNQNFVFPSRKKATKELHRIAEVLKEMIAAQSTERRQAAGSACPLGHAMDLLPSYSNSSFPMMMTLRRDRDNNLSPSSPTSPDKDEQILSSSNNNNNNNHSPSPPLLHQIEPLPISSAKEEMLLHGLKNIQEQTRQSLESSLNTIAVDFPSSPFTTINTPQCSVCESKEMMGGRYCSICDYRLCADCQIIYCRMGHACRIWTMPEAHCMTCTICQKTPITSGYRCLTCETDICDLCTTKDSRNAFLLWPRRELQRVVAALEAISAEAPAAKAFLAELARHPQAEYSASMSRLCKWLGKAGEALQKAQEEGRKKVAVTQAHRYGTLKSREML